MLMSKQQLEQHIEECEGELNGAEQGFDSVQIELCRQRLRVYRRLLVCGEFTDEVNELGNGVKMSFHLHRERDFYDWNLLEAGWRHYETSQDAPYFGIWVHTEKREIITFAEGDEIHVSCPTEESFLAELKSINEYYILTSTTVIEAIGNASTSYEHRT